MFQRTAADQLSYNNSAYRKKTYFATYQMISFLFEPPCGQLNPTLYGFEIVDEFLIPTVGKNLIPEGFTVVRH